MLRRGRLQEVLLQEQQGYVQPVRRSESYSSLLDSKAWIFQRMACLISSLTYLIVGHLLSCRGWHCICLFTSIPWFDSSVQSVCALFLLVSPFRGCFSSYASDEHVVARTFCVQMLLDHYTNSTYLDSHSVYWGCHMSTRQTRIL